MPWPIEQLWLFLERSGFLAIVLFVLVAKVGSVAAVTLMARFIPASSVRAAGRLRRHPFAMAFVGAVAGAIVYGLLQLVSGESRLGLARYLGALAILGLAAVPQLIGIGGVYLLAGHKAQRAAGGSTETEAEVFHGGALVETATLLPVLGQIASVFLLLAAFGCGLVTLADAASPRDE